MAAVHDFADSLARSKSHASAGWWLPTYREAFPTLQSCVEIVNDGWAQRAGIDRILTLECGRIIRVDEKVRERDYGDILLEYWSDRERKIRGWICKPLACDFIAYAIVETATCYLLPTLLLQNTWRRNAIAWNRFARDKRDGFRLVEAANRNYTTCSIAVPTAVLLDAIKDSIVVSWGGA